ncbi:MAG: hypothetical protein QXI23_00505 [Candidatus Aenigmatarchaeota archaeon]
MFDEIWNWAYAIGMTIKEKNSELVRRLIFDIRAEETPGRFLEKLSNRLSEYKTNKNIALDVSIKPELFKVKWQGDKFYYMKSAIIAGLTDALAT